MIKNSLSKYCSFALTFILLFPNTAYAYLDMGTGSYLLQILIGSIVGGLFWIKLYWWKIKTLFSAFFKRKNDDD